MGTTSCGFLLGKYRNLTTMPGHIKKSEGADPDPDPWLVVSEELRKKLNSKPYDAKKSCWVPDKATGGYFEGLIDSTDGDKIAVKILESGDVKVFKKDQVGQVNPPKFDCQDDMSGLTYLGDACVLWNSVVRYKNELIYTYSGLFCIAINPYKRFPIYTQRSMEIYNGKRRSECPPHIFGVAEGSYQGMMNLSKNQSILITGESGAGKTENTKKVISYFASIGATGKKKEGEIGLEDKIVNTNPVLEAWGNAKTVRNDNSSRFGKFIRIWFNMAGKLSGADMVIYLLEKSRLTFQAELERCYHSFYNIMSDQVPDIKEKCFLSDDIYDYWWVSQGKTTVPSIDDKEDMMYAHEAYKILGFTAEETYNIYKLTAVVMHMGNMTKDFVPVGKEEQAEIKDDTNAQKVAGLCGIDTEWMINYFCKPKLKVGTEWVSKGQTCSGASNSVGGIGRKIYENLFRFVVDKCNETLIDPSMKKVHYIGCLDIAGFEIFDYNGFEQICINFVNEKLQQFFNQHMFTLEQEEYVKEGIEWANVDFGMDLQVCITMFEKPMGLLAIWEEESLFPKATDDTFRGKLMDNLLGKPGCGNFQKPDPRAPDKNAHFGVSHYAATVSYNLTDWLVKNKDPINDTVVELMKNGSNALLVECFLDHPGQPTEVKKDGGGGGKKKGGGKTVTSFFKSQLDDLMKVLYSTDPSFIRCVVPNTHKQPGGVQPELIMHQYQCNGVLAGIAICRLGFPNKMLYPDFKARYNIMAAGAVAKAKNDKSAAGAVMDVIKLDKEKFRLGHTKVFFSAGILGFMEEVREDKIGSVLALLQAQARGKASRITFKKMQDQKLALYCLQRTIRNFRIGKTWLWWQLWLAIKPNLKCTKFAQYKAEYEEKIAIAEAHIGKALEDREKVTAVHNTLLAQKNELVLALQSGGSAVQEIIDKTVRVEAMAADVQKQVDEVNARIKGEKEEKNLIGQAQSKVNAQKGALGEEIKALEGRLAAAESDRADKDDQIRTCKEEIEHQNDMISKLGREKKGAQESRQKTEEDIQTMEDRCNHLSRVKAKLEQSLDEAEDSLEREKKSKGDVEKLKRKVEGDLKLTQETVSDLERMKAELTQSVQRKEKEAAAIGAKIEDEATLGSKYSKQTKELQSRLEELDEELSIERNNRAKAEKSRAMLKKDLEDLGSRLEEAGANTATQVELNKKREAELARLKGELEELNIAHEGTLAALRMKHNNTMADLGEQIDNLNANKMKAEKDKAGMERDLADARSGLEDAVKGKAELDKQGKLLQGSIVDSHQKLDELARALNEADSQKKRLDVEKQDLERQIEEGEAAMASLNKLKTSLVTQVDDTKALADAEAKDRAALLTKYKAMSTELENVKEKIENEHMRKSDALKALSKAQAELQLWKSRFETEGMGRIEELESARNKLQGRIQEAEENVDALNTKIANAEKSRVGTAAEVEASQNEGRNYSSELYRLKAAQDEAVEQLDIVKRENKNLADEIKDLLDQLGDGGRSIHDLDKQRRRLEQEKEELQAALEEAEGALEQEENKVLRSQLELSQVRQEIDRRVAEKEEEFNTTRKNHQRAMESMSASLESEQRAKGDALRVKKKLEGEINELEIGLDHANKANAEGLKAVKRYQLQLRETIQAYEEEAKLRQQISEACGIAERKGAALSGEAEESRALLDSADRAKRQIEAEIADSRNAVNEMTSINSRDMNAKRALEGSLHTMQAEIDAVLANAKNAEEKSKKAMIDAARLADELRAEQDHTMTQAGAKKALESQFGDLEARCSDAEAAAMKGGKAAMAKLENRIRELESELSSVQSRTSENMKAFQRAERKVKELAFASDEDKKNQDRMSDLASKLQQKIKTYKTQIEEAEEIAALNLAKYRKAQQELEETEERAKKASVGMHNYA